MSHEKPILIVDDEDNCLRALQDVFELEQLDCVTTNSTTKALDLFKSHDFDIVITDVRMPVMNGIDLLRQIKRVKPETYVIMLTGYSSLHEAIAAIKLGAYDYIFKPVITEDLLGRIKEIFAQLTDQVPPSVGKAKASLSVDEILLGNSLRIQNVKKLISKIANSDLPVLILGESGTGKELAAQTIHNCSDRANKPFVTVHCAALPDMYLESELFGYEKGATTNGKVGKIEQANGGTLFLDEIGEMKITTQTKLLRAMEGEFQALGSNKPRKIDVRIISATTRGLNQAIMEKTFLADLYHRLNAVTINMPSLREMTEDVPVLADHFAKDFAQLFGRQPMSLSPETMMALKRYPWPGNVRELANVIRRAIVLSDGDTIREFDLPSHFMGTEITAVSEMDKPSKSLLLEDVEREHILKVLDIAGGNKSEAATLLGIHRDTLLRKLKKYNLE